MEAKEALLKDHYGDDFDFDTKTGLAKIGGRRAYVLDPTRELSIRHELIAELAASGLKPKQIARMCKTNPHLPDGNHYAHLLHDPRVRALAREKIKDRVGEAQGIMRDAVVKAAENVSHAVNRGDMKMSTYVLDSQGIGKQSGSGGGNTNINMNFGDWLSSFRDTKKEHTINPEEGQTEPISNSASMPIPLDGERL